MKTTLLDVLSFMFEHYMEDGSDADLDREAVASELGRVGFDPEQVSAAFDWLEGLNPGRQDFPYREPELRSFRIFSQDEVNRLNRDSRGFLLFLEQVGIMDARNRELVIDRVMALDSEEIDLDQLKWIVLMVLFNQTDGASAWLEGLVMDEIASNVH
jgi:Smg protein